jgi:beta-1,4-mannosyl-glycoprotein beta-1,4-N-acetylglucosaminyltransferase
MDKPLIIDCFMYNGEPIVEFRLEYLYNHVDYIVLIESWYTHSGNKKSELYYEKNIDFFKKYQNKLIVKIIEQFPNKDDQEFKDIVKNEILPEVSDSWVREVYNRNCIQNMLLEKFKQPFIVFVCDVDEIPKQKVALDIHNYYNILDNGMHLQMYLLQYGFNWKKNRWWYHPFVINDKGTTTLSYSKVRLTFNNFFEDAGWHITYCFSINDNIKKLESFAHTEFNKSEYKNKNYMLTCILTGRSFLSIDKQDILIPTYGKNLPEGWEIFQNKINQIMFEDEYPNIK